MSIQLRNDRRYISIDFEATGLDTVKDEPIQVGLVVADSDFRLIDSFSALIRPQRDIKELKHIVGYITGLSLDKLSDALSKEEIGQKLMSYIKPDDILIGHNVSFDIAMLQQCCDCNFGGQIDTFPLAQSLIQYPPSYALEILAGLDKVAPYVDIIGQQARNLGHDLVGSHDALHDSTMTLGLFHFFVDHINNLDSHYPFVSRILAHSEFYQDFLSLSGSSTGGMTFPVLTKPVKKAHKQVKDSNSAIPFDEKKSGSSWYIGHHNFADMLEAAVGKSPCIIAFHTNQKVELAKNILASKGITNIGFAKPEQYLDIEKLESLAQQESLEDFEVNFLLKYLSHHHQGLRVIDLNTKHDYFVYHLLQKNATKSINNTVLCSHGGLYRLLDDPRYHKHRIFFFDSDWWHFSYNRYHSQSVDFGIVADFLEKLVYIYTKRRDFGENVTSSLLVELKELQQSFVVFMGTIGIDITKQFTGIPNKKIEMGPLSNNTGFYHTQKIRSRVKTQIDRVSKKLSERHLKQLSYHEKQLTMTMEELIVIRKTMQDNTYLRYTFSAANTYVDFQEFQDLFANHHILYLSHAREYFPHLGQKDTITDTIYIQDRDRKHIASSIIKGTIKGDTIFILSSVKKYSKVMFEYFSQQGLSDYSFFVENITGGVGKNTYLIKQSSKKKIVIGGYYFLLNLFAKSVKLDTIIVYNAKGPMEKTILADIQFYGKAACG